MVLMPKKIKKRRKLPQTANPFVRWKSWRYKNTFLLVLSIALFIYFAESDFVQNIIAQVGNFGYIGAFVAGIFFVSTFTVVPAMAVLFHLAEQLHPIEVAVLAGLGAMLGDYIIFRFMKDRVFDELLPLARKFHTSKVKAMFTSPYFAWLLPLVGATVIASPLPDEVGVSMLGLSKIKKWQFFLLAFVLNAVGILIVILLAQR
jgi:hypothetical protein